MPCGDITDTLKITLDDKERVSAYTLNKRTCGGAVGQEALISDWLRNRPADEVLTVTSDVFLDAHHTTNQVQEYLLLKHFLAVQRGLAIMFGRQPGGVNDYCTVETIEHSPDGTELIAHLHSDAMTDEIKSCGRCCGTKQHLKR